MRLYNKTPYYRQYSIIATDIFNYQHEIMYGISIIHGVYGSNEGAKLT